LVWREKSGLAARSAGRRDSESWFRSRLAWIRGTNGTAGKIFGLARSCGERKAVLIVAG
jgi:hypothetical protein